MISWQHGACHINMITWQGFASIWCILYCKCLCMLMIVFKDVKLIIIINTDHVPQIKCVSAIRKQQAPRFYISYSPKPFLPARHSLKFWKVQERKQRRQFSLHGALQQLVKRYQNEPVFRSYSGMTTYSWGLSLTSGRVSERYWCCYPALWNTFGKLDTGLFTELWWQLFFFFRGKTPLLLKDADLLWHLTEKAHLSPCLLWPPGCVCLQQAVFLDPPDEVLPAEPTAEAFYEEGQPVSRGFSFVLRYHSLNSVRRHFVLKKDFF